MSTRVVVIEDEAIVRKDISMCLKRLGYEVVGTGDTAEKAVSLALELKPDIFLMDIRIKGDKTGIDAATEIKKSVNIPIIYLTAYADEATLEKAKVTEPYGYILKPFKEIDIKTSVEMALHKHKSDMQKFEQLDSIATVVEDENKVEAIFIRHQGKLIRLEYENIIFVEALKDYVNINLLENRYTVHSTMANIEKKLPNKYFSRIHRSYIINVHKIESLDASAVSVSGFNKELPIGASYKESLLNRINQV
jgi:two-component system response regulator LytT